MKRTLTLITLILAFGLSMRAQNGAVGSLTASSTDCTATNACIQSDIPQSIGGSTLQLTGTWSGTVQFEGNADVDSVTPANRTWVSVLATPSSSSTAASSATANGVWQVNVSAYKRIRIRVSAYSSGTIGATINLSQTSARGGAGGGGGGAPTGAAGGDLGGTYPNPTVAQASGALVAPTGAPVSRTLAVSRADTFNVLDNGALGTNTATAIGTTYGASVSALATYMTSTGATPFSWATNPLYGLTFSMAVSANQATTATPLTFTETLTDGTWSATVALWQDPGNGNYLVQPGMAVTGSCIAANTTVSSVDRTAGDANYGKVTLSQNTSTTCASTTVITFTLTNAQLQALTLDWLGIQTAVARADAANGGIGSEVDIPAGHYILNHTVLNATGVSQGIKEVGGGAAATVITFSSDLGTDFCGFGESARNGGSSSASSYRDFQLVAPTQSLTMGTSPNGMDGLCIGSNAKVDSITGSYFHAAINGIGNHWFVNNVTTSNGGYGIYFGPYNSGGGVGNQVITNSNLVGNTISSLATAVTDTMDSMTMSAVHTGFGPYGFYQEAKPSTVTNTKAFLTNSTLTNVYMESLGNGFIFANGSATSSFGFVGANTIIGGGLSDVGGHSAFKIAANAVTAVVDVVQFYSNTMIGTNWNAFGTVATAIVDASAACGNNTWINDDNFITGGTTTIPALSCGQGPAPSTFVTSVGSGTFFANVGSTLSSAFLPVTDLGSGTAQAFALGTPFAGLNAAPAAAFTYMPVFTYAPLLSGVTKSVTATAFTQGQFVYPGSGGLLVGSTGAGAIGTVFATSAGGTATVAIRLDPALGAAGGNALGAATATSLLATGNVDGTAPITITTGTTANLGSTFNSGYTLNQEGTAGTGVTYTLPATVVGKQYCVANSGTTSVINAGVLTVYPLSSSFVILNGVVNTVGGGGTHGVASGGAAGDAACFVAIDATHWQVWVGKGTWTEN